jgi:hypothetical protein
MIAYTGKWRVEGDKFITKVDVAWNPALVGTEQVRFWRLKSGKLRITTAPLPNPNVAGSTMIGTLVWERENGNKKQLGPIAMRPPQLAASASWRALPLFIQLFGRHRRDSDLAEERPSHAASPRKSGTASRSTS